MRTENLLCLLSLAPRSQHYIRRTTMTPTLVELSVGKRAGGRQTRQQACFRVTRDGDGMPVGALRPQ